MAVLLVGTGPSAYAFLDEMQKKEGAAERILGILSQEPRMAGKEISGIRVIGAISDLGDVIDKYNVKAVVLGLQGDEEAAMKQVKSTLQGHPIAVKRISITMEDIPGA